MYKLKVMYCASNIDAIVDGNHRVNRALKAGGDAVGAKHVLSKTYLVIYQCVMMNV